MHRAEAVEDRGVADAKEPDGGRAYRGRLVKVSLDRINVTVPGNRAEHPLSRQGVRGDDAAAAATCRGQAHLGAEPLLEVLDDRGSGGRVLEIGKLHRSPPKPSGGRTLIGWFPRTTPALQLLSDNHLLVVKPIQATAVSSWQMCLS